MKKILVIVIATIALVSTAKSQWTKCGDLFGGNIHCFVSTDTELYAGTTSGVYYTNKSTAEWKNTSLYYLDILSLAVNDMFVFAGTSEGSVYRSSNKGDKWLKVNELDSLEWAEADIPIMKKISEESIQTKFNI